jgi:hypothetical protein
MLAKVYVFVKFGRVVNVGVLVVLDQGIWKAYGIPNNYIWQKETRLLL